MKPILQDNPGAEVTIFSKLPEDIADLMAYLDGFSVTKDYSSETTTYHLTGFDLEISSDQTIRKFILLDQTKKNTAEAMIEAHFDHHFNNFSYTCQIYLDLYDNVIDYTFSPALPEKSFLIYKITGWSLGDLPESESDKADFIESALDQHGLNLVPESVEIYTQNGIETVYICYA